MQTVMKGELEEKRLAIGEALQISRNTVSKYISQLEKKDSKQQNLPLSIPHGEKTQRQPAIYDTAD